MRKAKKWIAPLAIFLMTSFPIGTSAIEYDIGSGGSYNNGCGYEESCCVPNACMIGLGILAAAGVVAGIIIWANSDSGHGHS